MDSLRTIFLAVIVAALVGCHAPQPPLRPQYVPTEAERAAWPKTVDEAATRVLSWLDNSQKEEMRNTKKKDLWKFHFTLGLDIRNGFGLLKGNDSLMADCHAQEADDASGVIIEAVWQRLQKP
jgi:hypothetical protein